MEEQIRNYQKILKTNPTDVPAFTALEELYIGTDSWRELVQLYEDRIKHVRDFEQEQVLLEKSAGVWLHKISDVSQALTCYGRILRINPESRVALEGLRDIHASKNEWKKLADVSEKLVVLTEDSVERAELYQRLGALYVEHLERRESALVAWGHALAADPKRTDVMASLRGLYEELGYYSKVWDLLERERESGQSEKEDLGQKYLEVGRKLLAEPLFEEICRKSLEQAKSLLTDSTLANEILTQLEEAKSAWEASVKKLRVEAVEAPDKTKAVNLYRQIAEIFFLQGKHEEQVEENLNKCVLLQPGNVRVLGFTERYFLDDRRPKELLDRLEEIVGKVKDPRTAIFILERIALHSAVHLQDRKATIEAYQRIMEIDPGHPTAGASLVEYFQEDGRWAEVVELLRSRAERQHDVSDKADILLEIAKITSDQLKDPEAARFLYEEILRLEDHNVYAAAALVKPYEKSEEWAGLVRCLEIQLEYSRDKKEQVKLLGKIATVHETHRDDQVEAFKTKLRALLISPSKKKLVKEVMTLGEQTGRFQELVTAFQATADSGELKGKALLELLGQLVSIYENRLNNASGAIRTCQKILELDPKNMPALDALERLQAASGGSVELVGIYRQQLQLVRSGEKRKELLYKLAAIYKDRMADFGQAIAAYEEILEIDEEDGTAWSSLAQLQEREGNWEQAAQALEKSMEFITDPGQLVGVKFRLSGIYEQRLNDTEKALQLCNEILSSADSDPETAAGTVTILERLQGRGVSPLRIAEILQPYYALAGDWRRHIDMLELRLEGCSSPEERVALLERIAQVYEEELQQKELAFTALGRAFKEVPEQAKLKGDLVRLAEQTNHLEELAGFFEEAIGRTEDKTLLISLDLSLGELYLKQLNRPRKAITCYQRVLSNEKTNLESLVALTDLFRTTAGWDELAAVLRARIEQVQEPEEQKALLLELAQINEEELHDRPTAIELLQQVHEMVGDELEILRRLDSLLEQAGLWPDLAAVLEKEIPLVSQEEASELNLRLGRVRGEKMEDREHAVEHYRQVLTERPDDSRAIAALESLLGRPDSAPIAAEILLPIYESNNDWAGLVRALDVQVEHLEDKRERVEALLKVAAVYDQQLSQKDRAFASLRRAFSEDCARQDVLQYMERLAEKSGAYDELTAALEDAVGAQENPEQQVFLLQTLANLYRDKLRRPDLAATSLRRLLEIEPSHAVALASLETLYRDTKSLQDLGWVLSRQAEFSTDPDKKRDLLVQVAQIREEQLGDMEGAIEAYSNVFASHPEDIHAAKQLDRLYQLTNRWEEDAALLPKLANLSKNVLGVIDYNRRLAEIYAEQLDDPGRAVQIYSQVLEVKPNHPETVASIECLLPDERCRLAAAEVLESVYRSSSEWRKLAAVLEMRLVASVEPDQKIRLYSQLRDIYETKIEEKALAFNVATRAFKEQPQDIGVQKDLLRLSEEGGFFEEMVGVLLDVADHHVGTDLATNLRKKVAEINEKHLNKRAEAIEQWEHLMESHGQDPEVLAALERLYREEGNFAALVNVYRAQVELTEDLEQRKDLLFRTAACLSEGVEDIDGSIVVYHQILELDPRDARALKLLDGLLVADERWQELASILTQEISLAPEEKPEEGQPDVRQDFLLRMAHLQLHQLKDLETGLTTIKEALARNQTDPRAVDILEQLLPDEAARTEAAEVLEPVYRAQSDFKKLVAIMEVRLAGREDLSERLVLFRELMQIYEEELTQKPLAFMVACRAFRENFTDEGIRTDIERLAEQTGSYEELAGVFEEAVEKAKGSEVGPVLERRLAQLKESYLEDKDEAVSHWRAVLSSDPDDIEALKALERLYRERGAYSELVGILRHMAGLEENVDKKKDLYHEVATFMEERLGRNDGAIEAYHEILADDPQDLTVLKLLDRLLEKEDRWQELSGVLAAEIEHAGEGELTSLQLRLAQVLRSKLSQAEEALALYSTVIQREPGQPETITALVEMFDAGESKEVVAKILVGPLESAADWRHLIAVLEVLHNASEDPEEKKAALVRIAGVYEKQMDQKELAFATLGRAFGLDPTDENVRLTLERLASETDNFELLATVFEQSIDNVEDHSVLLALHRRLASLFSERLGDQDAALTHLQAVANLDSKDASSLMALENSYRQNENYDSLADVLRKRVKLLDDPEQISALLYEIASIHEEKLSDLGGAIQTYREILEHQPQDLNALRMLDRLCVDQGRIKDLAEVLIAQINLLDQLNEREEALDARFRLAHLYEHEFGDMERAATLYKDILQLDPSHVSTVEYLQGLLAEGRSFDGASLLLETAYEQIGDWKKYLDILETQVRQSRVMARRLELLTKIAEIQEHRMGLKTLAFNTYVRMFHEDLTDNNVRAHLERIAAEDENLEALAAVYEEELDNVEEPAVGAAIALKVAVIQETELADEDEAVRFYKAALRFDGKNLEALKAMDRLCEKREDYDRLTDILSKEIDLVTDKAEQVLLLYRLGKIYYELQDLPAKAVGYFRQVIDLEPSHIESMKILERIFAEMGDHEALHGVLSARMEYTKDHDEQIELVARVGDLAADQLGRPDEAIELWKKVSLNEEYADDAFGALDRLYETTERWVDLAQLIESRMEKTVDPEKIATLSGRLGWVKGEKLGELEDAMKHYQEVLRLDPKDPVALQSLRRIYTSSGQWEELLSILRKLVPLQEDMTGVKGIRFELAEILGEKLSRRDEAIDAAKRAVDIEPHTADELDRLSRIFQVNEAWQDAVNILEQSAEVKEIDTEKIDTLLEVASIWKDKIERPLGASPAYEKILEIDPFHEEAFRTADGIYRENKEWRRLTTLLEKRLVHIRERKDRLTYMKEIAEIYESHLGQKELAFARYCAAFREDFSDDFVLSKLENLAEETEDYDTLLEVFEDAADELGSGSRAVNLYRKIANIYRLRLGNTEEAEARLLKAVELDKREVASLDSLAELYRDQERWEDLVRILDKKYDRSDEIEERKEIRGQIALLQEEKLERVDLALESFRRILELDGRDARAVQSLIRLYQQEERWQDLIQILKRAADQAEDRQIAVNYLFNIASIWETELNNDDEAIDAYRDVLESDATHAESLKALERIYTRLDQWSELLQVFERETALIQEPGEKVKLFNKMGSIWEERFSNLENAAACHESILELDENNLHSVKALERLVRRMGDFKRLIELFYKHIELIGDRNEQVDIHLSIGEVWYRELSRVDKAEDVFTKALEIDPQSRPAIHALGQLYEKSGNWFNAIEMLHKEAELCGATPEAVDLYYRMGKINEDMLLDSGAARDAYSKALAIDPSYLPAIKALKLIFYLDKEYDQYLEMMIQEAEHTEDVEEKTRLFFEIGKFLQEQHDDSAQAASYYEESLRRTPDFLPAAKPLADIYFRTEQWEKAETMMEVVVEGLDRNTESKELCRQYYRLGYITEKLGKGEKALDHYRESYELDATYLPALEGLGNALLKAEQWEEAYRIYQTILIHHRDSLSDAEVAELYWQIGDVNFQMQEVDRAIGSFKKALEIDETHLASLQYLIRIHEEQENWEEAYDFGMQMVDAMDEDDLYGHYVRLGDLCRENLQDPFRAVDALQGALKLQPGSLDVLTRLLTVFSETRQIQKAIEILDQIVKVESRPRRLVDYHMQAGQLLKEELHDDIRAVEHFNAALDIDPSSIKAFQEISQILTGRKDWLSLKENYIMMIKRLPVEARKTKLALWKDLGELCRVVLRNLNESVDAFRMITNLDPNDVEALATLGDLLAAKPATVDEAIDAHHRVLIMSADRIKSYRMLWKMYNERKEYDKVYAIASILRYLKKADDEESKIVNYFARKAPQVASKAINDKLWEDILAHPGVKVPFTRIFGLLYRKAPAMFIKDHKELNLRKQNHVDLARDRSLFAHNFRIAAKILGGKEVELFAMKDEDAPQPPGLMIAPTRPTSMIAYREMFREDKKKLLLFQIGRQLAMARPEFFLAYSLPVKDLEILLHAACQVVDPSHTPPGDPKVVETVRNKLRKALTDSG
ncbi:MAG: tetratricopeptide repeat protein, partial [Deltaproteobacteria bacterium]|nr:tetratricopeptide repeat protein [Deltaproteobacteria bacterium]